MTYALHGCFLETVNRTTFSARNNVYLCFLACNKEKSLELCCSGYFIILWCCGWKGMVVCSGIEWQIKTFNGSRSFFWLLCGHGLLELNSLFFIRYATRWLPRYFIFLIVFYSVLWTACPLLYLYSLVLKNYLLENEKRKKKPILLMSHHY